MYKCILSAIFILFGLSHATFSIFRWVEIHECNGTGNGTTMNILMEDTYYQCTAALYAFCAILHAFATWLIFVKYMEAKKEAKNDDKGVPILDDTPENHELCYCRIVAVTIILFLMLFGITATGLVFDFKTTHCSNHSSKYSVFSALYHSFLFLITSIANVVLVCLVKTTVHVGDIWKSDWETEPIADCDKLIYIELERKVHLDHTKKSREYHSRGKTVMLLTRTYKSWFVVHWTIYFLGIFIDLTYVLRPWVLGGESGVQIYKQQTLDYIYVGVFTLYDIILFLIPFGCGLRMNHYHNQSYKKLVNNENLIKGEDDCEKNASLYALKDKVYKITKNEDYDFTPSIFAIDIPLKSPGYTLTIFISMVTLILSFLVQPLQLNTN